MSKKVPTIQSEVWQKAISFVSSNPKSGTTCGKHLQAVYIALLL